MSTVQVRLPGAQRPIAVNVTEGNNLADSVTAGAQKFGTMKRETQTLVISREDGSRQVIQEGESIESLNQAGGVIELWDQPAMTQIVLIINGQPKQKEVLIDYNVDLGQMVSIVQNAFKDVLASPPPAMVFAVLQGQQERWLQLNMPLNQQHFDASTMRITAHQVSDLCTDPALSVGGRLEAGGSLDGECGAMSLGNRRSSLAPTTFDVNAAAIHRAMISIQSRLQEQQKLSAKEERWCVLKDNLLYLYASQSSATPVQCLPLELFVALNISLLKGRQAIVLRRSNRQASAVISNGTQNVDFYLLQPPNDEIQRQWGSLLRRRCLSGAKVFGAPLDEVLERQQRKPPIPKLVELLVGYLDTNALPVRCERLLVRPPADRTLLECYRADVDQGLSLDLASCKDPWTVAALLRQYIAELPEPLLGSGAYSTFLAPAQQGGVLGRPRPEWDAVVCEHVSRLVLDRFILLKYMCSFLLRLAEASPGASSSELAQALAASFLRSSEQDDADRQAAAITVTQLLIEQHKKLYTLRDGKKMRLEFKSQRKAPVVDLQGIAKSGPPAALARGASQPSMSSSGNAAVPSMPRHMSQPSMSSSATPNAAPAKPVARPTAASTSTASSTSTPTPTTTTVSTSAIAQSPSVTTPTVAPTRTPKYGAGWPESEKQAFLAQSPAANAAAALASLGALRASAEADPARLADVRTTANFLRKHIMSWMARRQLQLPATLPVIDRQSSPRDQVLSIFKWLEHIVSHLQTEKHPDVNSKLVMIRRSVAYA